MGKITVNHYLNTNLKPYVIGEEKLYKVYFLLRYQNKNTKIKSLVNLEVTEIEYANIVKNEGNLMNQRMKREISLVENVIGSIERANVNFDFKTFNDFWNLATYPIIERFQGFIKWRYENKFNSELDIYQRQNFENYNFILQNLKDFVVDNPLCISDEIYYIQLYDKQMIDAINQNLKERRKIKMWEIKEQNKDSAQIGDIINISYEPIEYKTIEFLIEELIKDGGFNLKYSEYLTGNIGDWKNYFNNIINSFSAV